MRTIHAKHLSFLDLAKLDTTEIEALAAIAHVKNGGYIPAKPTLETLVTYYTQRIIEF